jgi:hypothetical protein
LSLCRSSASAAVFKLRAFSSSAGERNTVEQTVLGVVSGALVQRHSQKGELVIVRTGFDGSNLVRIRFKLKDAVWFQGME